MSIARLTARHDTDTSPSVTVSDLRSLYGFSFPDKAIGMYDNLIRTAERMVCQYIGYDSLRALYDCEETLTENQTRLSLQVRPVKAFIGCDEPCDFDERHLAVYPKNGMLHKGTKVQYTVGFGDNIPEDVCFCVAETVRYLAMMSLSGLYGKTSVTTDGGTASYEQATVPLALRVHLDRYRINLAV